MDSIENSVAEEQRENAEQKRRRILEERRTADMQANILEEAYGLAMQGETVQQVDLILYSRNSKGGTKKVREEDVSTQSNNGRQTGVLN